MKIWVQHSYVILLAAVLAVSAQQGTNSSKGSGSARPTQRASSPTPSLTDTQRWITNTLQENTGNSLCEEFDSRKADSGYGREFRCDYERYILQFDGCKVSFFTFRSHRNETLKGDSYDLILDEGEDKQEDSVAEFNLGAIDPDSVKAGAPRGPFGPLDQKTYHQNDYALVDICLAATDGADMISLRYPYSLHSKEHQPYKIHELCGLDSFVTARSDYAPRFVKALTHAVKLCGGKSSAF